MMAWVMSKAPAIRPPTAIAKSAFLFPNCIIWSFEDGHYIGARLTRKRKTWSAATPLGQRSDVRDQTEWGNGVVSKRAKLGFELFVICY